MRKVTQANNTEKALKLSQTIKDALSTKKIQKGSLGKYLAGNNEEYASAIEFISISADWSKYIMLMNCILSAMYILVSYGIATKPNDFNISLLANVPIVILLSFVSLVLSIIGFIFAKKISVFSIPPNAMRNRFILILLFDIFPAIASIMFNNVVIPSSLNFLMIVYVFSALNRLPAFRKWFSEYTVKPVRAEKKTMNQETIEKTSLEEESDDYNDGL